MCKENLHLNSEKSIFYRLTPLNHSSNPDNNNNLPNSLSESTTKSGLGVFRGRKPSRFLLRFGAVSDLGFDTLNSSRYNPYSSGSGARNCLALLREKEEMKRGGSSGSLSATLSQNLSYSDAVKRNVDRKGGKKELPSYSSSTLPNCKDSVMLQICNLDSNCEEPILRQYLLGQLKSITPVLSLTIESPTMAKLKVPSMSFAKQVVSHLHRKKFGHKRIIVSYIRDPSSAETSALKSQVAGLLKVGCTF